MALAVLVVVGATAFAQTRAIADLVDGDRWCVLGDGGVHRGRFHDWVWLFHLTRFPERTVDHVNAGLAGDTPADALRRLGWDVLAKEPTATSVFFGLEAEATDEAALREIVETLLRSGSRVSLVTPPPRVRGGAEAERAAALRRLAAGTGAGLIDLHAELERVAATVSPQGGYVLDPADEWVLAYGLLRASGVSGLVSSASIDLRTNRVVAENGALEGVRREPDGGVSFTWSGRALPFPVDPRAAGVLERVPFASGLSRETVRIIGLRAGNYELRIDDQAVRTASAEELAAGLELGGETRTPQYAQALDVLRLVSARAELVADSIRTLAQVEHGLAPTAARPLVREAFQSLLAARLEELRSAPADDPRRGALEHYAVRKEREREAIAAADRLARLARLTAQPRPHLYAIRPVR